MIETSEGDQGQEMKERRGEGDRPAGRESREGREGREGRENREGREGREGRGPKVRREGSEKHEKHGGREGHDRGPGRHGGRSGRGGRGEASAQTFRRGRAVGFLEMLQVKQETLRAQLGKPEYSAIEQVVSGELKAVEGIINEFVHVFELYDVMPSLLPEIDGATDTNENDGGEDQ